MHIQSHYDHKSLEMGTTLTMLVKIVTYELVQNVVGRMVRNMAQDVV